MEDKDKISPAMTHDSSWNLNRSEQDATLTLDRTLLELTLANWVPASRVLTESGMQLVPRADHTGRVLGICQSLASSVEQWHKLKGKWMQMVQVRLHDTACG